MRAFILLLVGVLGMASAEAIKANTVDFSSADGNYDAVFSISGNTLTITLSDLAANPTSAAQLISGLTFNISGAAGIGSFSGLGELSTINTGNGSYSTPSLSSLDHWKASETGTTISLSTLTGKQPYQLIIGPDSKGNLDPSLGGKYSNANNSINNFNPSVLGSAVFTLAINGIDPNSLISGVSFQLGTGPDATVVASVPDQGTTAVLFGLSLTLLGLFHRRFHKTLFC